MSADCSRRLRGSLAAAALLGVSAAHATTINVINNNAAGVGFNDATAAAAGIGCNAGETLGACRLRVFTTAASQWSALLNSNVPINVNSTMEALTCSGTTAVLGSAGPVSAFSFSPGSVPAGARASRAYNVALANSLNNSDLDPAANDINARFNLDIDNGTCLTGTTGWWYGTDPSVPVPTGRIPLLPVVFHELGHGLGFTSLVSSTSGGWLTAPDIGVWGDYLYDVGTSKLWKNMTDAERLASFRNDPNLVWTGPRVSKQSVKFLGPSVRAIINSPAAIAGNYDAQTASFGPAIPAGGTTGNIVAGLDPSDGAGASTTDGCSALTNAAAVAGNIALLDRGSCAFTIKVKNAQNAGAIGAIIANNAATGLPGMGGADATITIPSLGVTQALGTSIRAQLALPAVVNGTLGYISTLSGTNSGCVRMFAPNPIQPGSSVSHFHSEANPNLLMEP
ncbi:MAG: peptidase, partial [Rhodanobacteraceae bacterium]|nr:peptidase [Rhodanobacteraceae bacterium]